MVEDAARRYEGRVDVYAMNTDAAPGAASTLGISAIPAIVFFKEGREVGRMLGGNRARLDEQLQRLAI